MRAQTDRQTWLQRANWRTRRTKGTSRIASPVVGCIQRTRIPGSCVGCLKTGKVCRSGCTARRGRAARYGPVPGSSTVTLFRLIRMRVVVPLFPSFDSVNQFAQSAVAVTVYSPAGRLSILMYWSVIVAG